MKETIGGQKLYCGHSLGKACDILKGALKRGEVDTKINCPTCGKKHTVSISYNKQYFNETPMSEYLVQCDSRGDLK